MIDPRFWGAHAARVRELCFARALSFGPMILPEVRLGEAPKPAREARALPRLQQLIGVDIDCHGDVFREWQFFESFTHKTAESHDCFATDQNVETELAL